MKATNPDPVDAVLTDCIVYWVLKGLPRRRIDEMAAELRHHLTVAVQDGKSLEAVVGRDLGAFAEEWARATGEPTNMRDVLTRWGTILSTGLVVVLLEAIVVARSLTVPIYWGTVLLYLILVGVVVVLMATPMSPRLWLEKAPGARLTVIVGLAAMIVLSVCTYSLTTVLSRSPLFRLSPPATVALLMGAGVACWIARRHDATAPSAFRDVAVQEPAVYAAGRQSRSPL
ncbi:hypothetical protein [Alicyclobacillus macrosporangiidus]|uniref:hypothetical protein n=1 Tax=Alicyclobacillus macrosporangiidus TaxID=392015 RepID=UPI0004966A9F|nr:hypothetical protein [Alicyclobacillus macrosporangiidus]